MEFCLTLDMIRDYFTKEIQRSHLHCFRNIILGNHEDDITYYNSSGRVLLEERKIKPERDKRDTQKASKLADNRVSQGVCWENWLISHICTPIVRKEVHGGKILHVVRAYCLRT